MKTLKENNYDNIFPMKIRCRQVKDKYGFYYGEYQDYCGSELEVETSDIRVHHWSKYPDYSGKDYGVVCPVCGEFTVIDENTLPVAVKKNAEEIFLN